MKLGLMSAALPQLTLEQLAAWAGENGFGMLEIMCWPVGKSDRRYAGVTHIDVADLSPTKADDLRAAAAKRGVSISGLGYYPNPLAADPVERETYIAHLRKVIEAAELLKLSIVN